MKKTAHQRQDDARATLQSHAARETAQHLLRHAEADKPRLIADIVVAEGGIWVPIPTDISRTGRYFVEISLYGISAMGETETEAVDAWIKHALRAGTVAA